MGVAINLKIVFKIIMDIKLTLQKKEYDLILKLIQPKIDECEKMNNYGGDYGENLRFIKHKIIYCIKENIQE